MLESRFKFYPQKVHTPIRNNFYDAVVICLEDTEKGKLCIHPITEHIKNEYYQKSPNYMFQMATYICEYMNWYITEHDSLTEMTENDIEWFLNSKALDYVYRPH